MAGLAGDDLFAPRRAPLPDAFAFRTDAAPAALRLQIFADSSNADLAALIAQALAREGHSVVGGAHNLETIDAVVVIWSEGALQSPAMLAAARAAQRTTPIIPVSVGAVSAPPDFPDPQPMPLDEWRGAPEDPRWRFVLDELSLVALRRGAAAHARPDGDLFPPTDEPLAAAPRPRPAPRRRRESLDGRTLLMAGAAAFLFAVFALLPGRPDKPVVVADRAPPRIETAAVPPPAIVEEHAAPVLAPAAAPPPALVVDAVAPPTLAPIAPAFHAPAPSLKPKRPARVRATAPPPTPKPAAAVDPLAALIVKTTLKPAAKAPAIFKDCADCPAMLRIAPGRLAATDDRQIAVARPFALGAQEVTFAEWDACVIDGGCRAYRPADSGFGRGGRPVINVSFEDATAYADWLSRWTGARYRLPTDEEWTYAAALGGAKPVKGAGAPAPAGGLPADASGARGLLGNVWEWTADCTAWTPEGACAARFVKGGAWNTGDWRKTPRHRLAKPEAARDFDLGFRLARDL